MALSIIGTPAAVAATSITLPTHAIGDIIVIWAYRDGSITPPTKPAASGTTPAWVDIDAGSGGNTNSARSAYFVATATNHTSGTWTSSTGMAAIVIRGQSSLPIGAWASSGSTASNSTVAPAVTALKQADGTSFILEFVGHRTVTAWSAAPAGYTRQASVATEVALNTKDTTTSDGSMTQACTTSTNVGYRGHIIEILCLNNKPTIALNTPADAATSQSTTPTLNSTGSDTESNTLEYEVQVDTVNTFNSHGTAGPLLSDDFDDNSLDGTKWTRNGDAAQSLEQNQRLEITHTGAAQYNDVTAVNTYNLTGGEFFVKVVDVGNQSLASHEAIFQILLDANNKIWFSASGGNLSAFKLVGGAQTQVGASIVYSATTHLWWKIRESGGTIFWDTSSDGITWTNRWSLNPNPFAITAIKPVMQSGCFSNEQMYSGAYFDYFSTTVGPLLYKLSTTDTGFTAGHPFAAGGAVDFTVQAADILANSTTYYWRVRAIDPTGSNSPSTWSATRSFTTTSGVAASTVTDSPGSVRDPGFQFGGGSFFKALSKLFPFPKLL